VATEHYEISLLLDDILRPLWFAEKMVIMNVYMDILEKFMVLNYGKCNLTFYSNRMGHIYIHALLQDIALIQIFPGISLFEISHLIGQTSLHM
jgi:hypothetical protein